MHRRMAELDRRFAKAVEFVRAYDGPARISPSVEQRKRFYALYKQATVVRGPRVPRHASGPDHLRVCHTVIRGRAR